MKNRVAKWDNLKWLLITCVVIGHMLNSYRDDLPMARSIYFFVYTFHMPAFVFVTGLFSKKAIKKKNYDRAVSFLMLYLVTKGLLLLTRLMVNGEAKFRLLSEGEVPWYAFAIFVFLLLTMFTQRYKMSYVVFVAVLVGCLSGYDYEIGNDLVLSRIFVFYPFFLLGFYLDADKILQLTGRIGIKIASWVLLLVTGVICLKGIEGIYGFLPLLKGKFSYERLGELSAYGGVFRLLYYPITLLLIFALIAVVPSGYCFLSKMGSRTLAVYAIHYCLIYLFFQGFNGDARLRQLLPQHLTTLLLVLSVLLSGFLSLPPFAKGIQFLINPRKRED